MLYFVYCEKNATVFINRVIDETMERDNQDTEILLLHCILAKYPPP